MLRHFKAIFNVAPCNHRAQKEQTRPLARMDIEVARGSQVRARARARWMEEVKHPQLSFFVSRKSELLTGLLQPCVRTTDPLYPIMMTCVVFFRPFISPCLLLKLPILL